MNEAHFTAVKTRLELDDALTVHDSLAPLNTDGTVLQGTYCVLYGGSPDVLDDERSTVAQRSTATAEYVYTVRSVAPDPMGARSVARHVLNQLSGAVLTVTGRVSRPMRLTRGGEVDIDDTIRPPLWWLDDEYTLTTDPA